MYARLRSLAIACVAALLVECGQGRAIFNVDVLSFIGGQGNDTVPYTVPGGASLPFDNPPVKVTLLRGLGNSTVDSVTLNVGAIVQNRTGAGKVKFQIFFSGNQGSVYTGTPYTQDSATVASGSDTMPLAPGPIPITADSIFGQPQVYVGVRVVATAQAGPAMAGSLRLSKIILRIVLQDQIIH